MKKGFSSRQGTFVATLAVFAATVGCAESSFQGNAAKTSETRDVIEINGSESDSIAKPVPVKNGLVDVSFVPAGGDKVDGEKVRRPLVIYFALDITNSMGPNIQAIKDNIARFVSELKTRGFEPKIGMVTFRDSLTETFSLSSDIDAFTSFVTGLQARGGDIANEASLLALEEAVKRAESEDTGSDSLRAVLLVTDNPGHRGGDPGSGDTNACTIDSTVQSLNSLSKDAKGRTRIYHSVAPFMARIVRPCSGFNDGKAQMNKLLESIFTESPASDRGAELQWPFTGDTLINEFVGKLEKNLPQKDSLCLAKSAELLLDGKVRASWPERPLAEVLKAHEAGESLEIKGAIKREELPEFERGKPTLKVQRCCIEKSRISKKDLGSCDQEREQVVDFKIQVKD